MGKILSVVKTFLDRGGDIGGLWQIYEKFVSKAPEDVQKRVREELSRFLSLTKQDEGIWVRIRTKLSKMQVDLIDSLRAVMKDYQREYFDYCVCQAFIDSGKEPAVKEVIETQKPVLDKDGNEVRGKDGKVQMAPHKETKYADAENEAIVFLKQLAKEVKLLGPEAVLDRLLRERLTVSQSGAARLAAKFAEMNGLLQQIALAPLGVKDAAEIPVRFKAGFKRGLTFGLWK